MPRLRRSSLEPWSTTTVTTTNRTGSGSVTVTGWSRRRVDAATGGTTRSRSRSSNEDETRYEASISRIHRQDTSHPSAYDDDASGALPSPRRSSSRRSSSTSVPPNPNPTPTPTPTPSSNPKLFFLLAFTTLLTITTPPLVQALVPQPRAVIPAPSEPGAPLPPGSTRVANYVCRSQGECEPCPTDEIFTSVCSIYGNRKKLICERFLGLSEPSTSLNKLKDTLHVHSNPQKSTPQHKDSIESEQEEGEGSRGSGNGVVKLIGDEDPSGVSGFYTDTDRNTDPDPEALDDLRGRGKGRGKRSGTTMSDSVRMRRASRDHQDGPDEIVTWEACQRVVKKEKEDFYEFILCNLFFATASIVLLMYRHRVLASRQYGRLVARIGLSVTR